MVQVVLSDAIPTLNPDGSGRNNARSFRKGLLASLLMPQSGAPNPLACRPGILIHDYDTNGVKSLRVDQTATASSNVTVNAGAFVSERANQGTYIGWLETSAGVSVTPSASDATNPRIDAVYVQVQDKNNIATDTTVGAIADVVTGTASATPVNPAVTADGAVVLAYLYRPAASTTITTTNITDARKSTGIQGTVRRMLPGDTLADPGKIDGELRYRQAVGVLPSLIDFWDAAQGLWRGTQGFTLTQPYSGTPTNGQLSGTTTGGAIAILAIPDPGYPYRVSASAHYTATYPPGVRSYGYVNISNTQHASQTVYTDVSGPVWLTPNNANVFTGAQTASILIDPLGTGTVTWTTDARNLLTVRIDPA